MSWMASSLWWKASAAAMVQQVPKTPMDEKLVQSSLRILVLHAQVQTLQSNGTGTGFASYNIHTTYMYINHYYLFIH